MNFIPATQSTAVPPGRAALIVAHPGHELRIHGWLERFRPLVFVLTDGSGRTGKSRIASTRKVLENIHATPGPIFGRFSDIEFYEALLRGDLSRFFALARELSLHLMQANIRWIIGDRAEGYNPSHDVCRLLIDAAVAQIQPAVNNLEFPLVAAPNSDFCADTQGSFSLALTPEEYERKLEAARNYPELASEFVQAVERLGAASFHQEYFSPSNPDAFISGAASRPWYDEYGQSHVKAGFYKQALTFREHISPLYRALKSSAKVAA